MTCLLWGVGLAVPTLFKTEFEALVDGFAVLLQPILLRVEEAQGAGDDLGRRGEVATVEFALDGLFAGGIESELWEAALISAIFRTEFLGDHMGLNEEIEKGSRQLKTDGYPMSIGELLNVYRDGELDLHPDFQRFFRWEPEQKSRLIESILLGIPLPSVFVFQRKDGIWDVIDGVQRLSTIFEFVGLLKDSEGQTLPALVLTTTRYLPSLEGKRWEPGEKQPDGPQFLSPDQRIAFRRSKIDIKIVKSESSEQSKYDLFQRLNTGGTPATAQEVRNCILIMQNKPMYEWMSNLAKDNFFLESIALSERFLRERYEVELALRFILLKTMPDAELRQIKDSDLAPFLTDQMIAMA